MRKLLTRVAAWSAVLAVLTGAGLGAWWWTDLRWRPRTLADDAAEIERLLEQSGWVSPGLPGPTLWMVSFRTCPDCIRYKAEAFPALHAADVDTRVVMFARADARGIAQSTPAERATVAELWVNRRRGWPLLERWYAATPPEAWTAAGLPPADDDIARTAVVEGGRAFVERLTPLLESNGLAMRTPLLIWRNETGELRGAAGGHPATERRVREELGA